MSCQQEQGKPELLSETQYNMDVNRGGGQAMVVLHPSTWPGKGTKTDLEKLLRLSDIHVKQRQESVLAYDMKSLSHSDRRNLLFCAEGEQIILTRQIWQSACADCIQHESLDRRPRTAATSTLLHNVAAPLQDVWEKATLH